MYSSSSKKQPALQNPQPPKHNIGLHQLLKLGRRTLSRKSELVHKSGVDEWAPCQTAYHRKGLFNEQMGIRDLLAGVIKGYSYQ